MEDDEKDRTLPMTERSSSATDDLTQTSSSKERLWIVLASIPEGRVCSYGQLAKLAGMGRGARLVGRWLSQLPEGSTLPWHRVLNSQGQLTLPAGSPSAQEQSQRLRAEGVIIHNRRVNMARYSWPDPPE